ncbi:histamine H2 receptor-like [Apostichopus japonicus]|uniref:histamine H2 receptor-like n=1 Tax=Stichopus japonicus TaxID=307972 RepID=UPI003AB4F494
MQIMESTEVYTSQLNESGQTLYSVGHTCEISFLIILSVFISVGNGLNILILRSNYYPRSIHCCLLVSLSMADIGLGPIAVIAASSAILQTRWYGTAVCQAIAFSGELFRCVSLTMLTLLNLEKYIAILHPLRYTAIVTRRRTVYAVCWFWAAISIMYLTIYLVTRDNFTVEDQYNEDLYICVPMHGNDLTNLTISVSLLTPSFVTLTYTSVRIMQKIAITTRRRRILFANCPKRTLSRFQKILPSSLRHNMKAFLVLLLVSGMVYITWLPLTVRMVLAAFNQDQSDAWHAVEFITFWLTVSNSGCNIVIYYVMDVKYRNAFCIIFRKLLKQHGNFEGLKGRSGRLKLLEQKLLLKHQMALNGAHCRKPRARYFYVGLRNENGSITPTNVQVTSPPDSICPRRRHGYVMYDDMNIHSRNGLASRPLYLPFYSIPNGITHGSSLIRHHLKNPEPHLGLSVYELVSCRRASLGPGGVL